MARWWLLVQTALAVLALLAAADQGHDAVDRDEIGMPVNGMSEFMRNLERLDSPDATLKLIYALVCRSLDEAKQILLSMQAPPNAHLESKVGMLAHGRGWGDGLGWSQDVCWTITGPPVKLY